MWEKLKIKKIEQVATCHLSIWIECYKSSYFIHIATTLVLMCLCYPSPRSILLVRNSPPSTERGEPAASYM
jgi:hypothetical protein